MAFIPTKENLPKKKSAELTNPQPEADLNLETERNTEGERDEIKDRQEKPGTETDQRKLRKMPAKRPSLPPPVKDETVIKIEKILEDGLNDSYQRLSPIAKQEFRIKGEQTAAQIRDLLKGTHVKIKKILRLIFDWLRMLPGINHFFLEQEAKIKTDKIMALKNKL